MGFKINANEGFADFVMHQLYENESDEPLEIQFMMPLSDTFTINKIEIDFVLGDGKVKSVVSRVEEKTKAQEVYENKVSQG